MHAFSSRAVWKKCQCALMMTLLFVCRHAAGQADVDQTMIVAYTPFAARSFESVFVLSLRQLEAVADVCLVQR
jgi:hypothetical protein